MRHFLPFFELYKYRPEVADDFISGVALEYVGRDVRAKVVGRIIQLFNRRDPFYVLMCSI